MDQKTTGVADYLASPEHAVALLNKVIASGGGSCRHQEAVAIVTGGAGALFQPRPATRLMRDPGIGLILKRLHPIQHRHTQPGFVVSGARGLLTSLWCRS